MGVLSRCGAHFRMYVYTIQFANCESLPAGRVVSLSLGAFVE